MLWGDGRVRTLCPRGFGAQRPQKREKPRLETQLDPAAKECEAHSHPSAHIGATGFGSGFGSAFGSAFFFGLRERRADDAAARSASVRCGGSKVAHALGSLIGFGSV